MARVPITRTIPGYSYRRIIGTVLRKVRGRARRVRYNVTRIVTVPPREVEVRRKRKKKSSGSRSRTQADGIKARRPVKTKSRPKPKAKPKPKPRRTQASGTKVKRKRLKLSEAPKPVEDSGKWYLASDYERSIREQVEIDGNEVVEIDRAIFRTDPDADVIHGDHLFVWYKPKLPRGVLFSYKGLKGKTISTDKIFQMVRIWFFVLDKRVDKLKIFCRSSVLDFGMNYDELYDHAVDLYMHISTQIEETYSYYEVGDFLAWTGYKLRERASHKRKDSDKIGGT